MLQVAGWGYTEDGTLSDDLEVVHMPYVDHQTCFDALATEVRPIFTDDKFCAGYIGQSIGLCRGESGGGLVFPLARNNKYYIRGVVSTNFQLFTSKNTDPCFFTRVSEFLTWIQDIAT